MTRYFYIRMDWKLEHITTNEPTVFLFMNKCSHDLLISIDMPIYLLLNNRHVTFDKLKTDYCGCRVVENWLFEVVHTSYSKRRHEIISTLGKHFLLCGEENQREDDDAAVSFFYRR